MLWDLLIYAWSGVLALARAYSMFLTDHLHFAAEDNLVGRDLRLDSLASWLDHGVDIRHLADGDGAGAAGLFVEEGINLFYPDDGVTS